MNTTRTKPTATQRGKPRAQPAKSTLSTRSAAPRQPREGSTMWAVIKVLDGKRTPMSAVEIYSEIKARKLATGLKGKTPEQTVAATLAVHVKRGLYVERAAPGKFQLKKPAAAKPTTLEPAAKSPRPSGPTVRPGGSQERAAVSVRSAGTSPDEPHRGA